MLSEKQIEEIREHLSRAQNPLFLFDNDADGLSSFLLLQRYIGRGRGVPIKSFPELKVDYFRRVLELEADYIFILDKPEVSSKFFEEVQKINVPVVWIDHHKVENLEVPDFVNYYNPVLGKKETSEPVTAICYEIVNSKKDIWLGVIGCISDKYFPDFYNDFLEEYPELGIKSKDAFEIFYKSDIGKIARIFNLGMMDRVTNVVMMLRFLMKVKIPNEILEVNSKNKLMHKKFEEIDSKIQKLANKAKNSIEEGLLFFTYSGQFSVSSELANELSYFYPDKIIVVGYMTGIKVNLSVRGEKIRDAALKSIEDLEGSTGGGHEGAVGLTIKEDDLEKFKENFIENLKLIK